MVSPPPSFSIIVPTFNRPAALAECLEALARVDYPPDRFEVIVVDDGSAAPAHAVVARFRKRLNVALVEQRHAGPAAARNNGAARATGAFLAFTDDDCTVSPQWLRALAARFARQPETAVGGRTRNVLHDNPCAAASQMIIDYFYARAGHARASFFTSNNLAVPAALFDRVGGFDPSFTVAAAEDREFCARWSRRGYALAYAPEAVVCHAHRLDLAAFWWLHFKYGRGARLFRRSIARDGGGAIQLEPARFYAELLRQPFARGGTTRAFRHAVLLGISQVANAAGFFHESVWPTRSAAAPEGFAVREPSSRFQAAPAPRCGATRGSGVAA